MGQSERSLWPSTFLLLHRAVHYIAVCFQIEQRRPHPHTPRSYTMSVSNLPTRKILYVNFKTCVPSTWYPLPMCQFFPPQYQCHQIRQCLFEHTFAREESAGIQWNYLTGKVRVAVFILYAPPKWWVIGKKILDPYQNTTREGIGVPSLCLTALSK